MSKMSQVQLNVACTYVAWNDDDIVKLTYPIYIWQILVNGLISLSNFKYNVWMQLQKYMKNKILKYWHV